MAEWLSTAQQSSFNTERVIWGQKFAQNPNLLSQMLEDYLLGCCANATDEVSDHSSKNILLWPLHMPTLSSFTCDTHHSLYLVYWLLCLWSDSSRMHALWTWGVYLISTEYPDSRLVYSHLSNNIFILDEWMNEFTFSSVFCYFYEI